MSTLRVQDTAVWLHDLTRRRHERTLIALAGLPGAGKTMLAARIASEVNAQPGGPRMIGLGMDGFHLTRAELLRQHGEPGMTRRGAPWTFDPAALRERLDELRDGRAAVGWPGFRHDIGDPEPDAQQVSPDTRVVLIEGLYLLLDDGPWREVSEAFDLRMYLDVPADEARRRLIARHMQAWNLDREAATRRVERNDDLNAEIVARTRPRADVLLVE